MPGISEYIDFAMESIFKNALLELQDIEHVWELRCTCLTFIVTCLVTFNEDLVVFANRTSVNVDNAISTSSLATYVRLHPFARVMEWLFNDGVIAAVFAAAHENADVVGASSSDSPLITALCRSLQVIDLVLKLQSTYFDLVRPIVKTQSAIRDKQVANPALASFEDAVLGNIRIVADLGLYCGSGHQELTVLSLGLLQKLAISRKMSTASSAFSGGRENASRMLTALQQDNDVDHIAASFIAPLQLDVRELEMGDAAPGFSIKQAILDLLDFSLETVPNNPSLAHCLLGFTCVGSSVTIRPDGRFANGTSLFHAIVQLFAETLGVDDTNTLPWLSALRRTAGGIIRKLAKSPLTTEAVLDQLRESGFVDAIMIGQRSISNNTTWCDRTCGSPEFLLPDSSSMFRDFLEERAALFELGSLLLRLANQRNAPTIRQKTIYSLLGSTTLSTGEQVQNVSIFDMFDFVDLELPIPSALPSTRYMSGLDFDVCKHENLAGGAVYDLRLVKELLLLREAELRKVGHIMDTASVQQCRLEADTLLSILQAKNQYSAVLLAQRQTLKTWVQLVTIMLRTAEFDAAQKAGFTLQALQIVLPKVDVIVAQESPITLPLMKLVYALMQAQDSQSVTKSESEASVANERLLHAFRTSLRGIAADSVDLRETCYQISRHFLKNTAIDSTKSGGIGRHTGKMIQSSGERLVDIVCEDALGSQGSCRVAALLMLEACVQLFHATKSTHIVRAMTRLNFIAVLVDSVRGIAFEFQQEKTGQGNFSTVRTVQITKS